MTPRLTIGITTKNRPDALNACLRSLSLLADFSPEVLVFDDGSEPAAASLIDPDLTAGLVIIHDPDAPGYIVGRNRLVERASAGAVLLLDDDTRILSSASILDACDVLDRDARVAAVAFAQAELDGRPWPAAMQPSPADFACLVPSYIGFAHLVRRSTFLSLGGYRESFVYYGEEKEYCLRVHDAGQRTVYLPDARVVHAPAPGGRSRSRYLRFVVRNDCLNALFNDPLTRVCWVLPARYALYFRMRSAWGIRDPWGWAWIARELMRELPRTLAARRPVSRKTIKDWRALRDAPVRYERAQA
jgi:GT2 family glycosyltransferase